MQLLEDASLMIIGFFFVVTAAIFAVRKITYHLYDGFPNALRVHQFLWKRKIEYYWSERGDFTFLKLLRLYMLWTLVRLDKYLPVIDCDRQAAKAQYFHTGGRYIGMGAFHYRYINPETWLVLLVRRFFAALLPLLTPFFTLLTALFPSFLYPRNEIVNNSQSEPAAHKS